MPGSCFGLAHPWLLPVCLKRSHLSLMISVPHPRQGISNSPWLGDAGEGCGRHPEAPGVGEADELTASWVWCAEQLMPVTGCALLCLVITFEVGLHWKAVGPGNWSSSVGAAVGILNPFLFTAS